MDLFNLSDDAYLVKVENRIPQLIIERRFMPKFVEVRKFMEEKAELGGKGIGSSSV